MKLFPWSGFLYELRRALLSVPLLVITIVIILITFAVLASIAESHPPPSDFLQDSGSYYYADGELHFDVFAYNDYGGPIPGASVGLVLYPSNTSFSPGGAPIANLSGSTTSSGIAQLSTPANDSNYSAYVSVTAPGWVSEFEEGVYFPIPQSPANGVVVPFIHPFTNTVLSGPGIKQTNLLQIFYPGPNGTAPPEYQVYWAAPNETTLPATFLPEASMHRLGTLSSDYQNFHLVVPRPSSSTAFGGFLQIELFTTQGRLVALDTNQSASSFFPPPGGAAGVSIALGFGGTIMVFLVPLMAILSSYSVYGRDRLTGVLEGVLARPVSRLGIAASRYLAVIAALCLAITAALVTLDALIDWVYGGFLPVVASLVLFSALLVEVGAFTGITFLLSHGLRSAGALVGIGLGLFALFALGWSIIPDIIGGLTGTIFSAGYETTIVQLQFFSPVQFLGLAEDLYFASVPGIFGLGLPTAPAAFGITLGSVIFTGLTWTVAPAVALFYVVKHHD